MTAAERLDCLGKLRPQLVRFARARLANPAHAEDAVQEALLAAVENIGSFAGNSSLSSWLTGILKHKIVDLARRSARDQWQELDHEGMPPETDAAYVAASGGPEQALQRRQLWEALLQGLRDLPARTADTYVLRELVGMDTGETCRALAISESHCAVMLHRARRRIRERMDPGLCAP